MNLRVRNKFCVRAEFFLACRRRRTDNCIHPPPRARRCTAREPHTRSATAAAARPPPSARVPSFLFLSFSFSFFLFCSRRTRKSPGVHITAMQHDWTENEYVCLPRLHLPRCVCTLSPRPAGRLPLRVGWPIFCCSFFLLLSSFFPPSFPLFFSSLLPLFFFFFLLIFFFFFFFFGFFFLNKCVHSIAFFWGCAQHPWPATPVHSYPERLGRTCIDLVPRGIFQSLL